MKSIWILVLLLGLVLAPRPPVFRTNRQGRTYCRGRSDPALWKMVQNQILTHPESSLRDVARSCKCHLRLVQKVVHAWIAGQEGPCLVEDVYQLFKD